MTSADDPLAFLSYVRADDEHDHGRITAFRARLEGEVQMHTGKPFKIFQDKKDLKWGQRWKERLDGTLLSVTFLIPVITPSYFRSAACRDEFDKFQLREKQLGENRLILPIYYLDADEITSSQSEHGDSMAKVLSSRNWANWRGLRFRELTSADVESAISDMAKTIKAAMKELESVIAASKSPPPPPSAVPAQMGQLVDLNRFRPDIPVIRNPSYVGGLREEHRKYLYYAYTTEYDEIVDAERLSDTAELQRLHKILKDRVQELLKKHSKGIKSSVAAIKAATSASTPSVTILLDNSGSMRGRKMLDTAAWSSILSNTLETCGVPTEVLGFTTRAWKGGKSREQWIKDGKPKQPGRLNDLRHIVYKGFTSDMKEASVRFALMVREGILKENMDGEAILWAYERAKKYGCDQAIIITITDGAPVDDSTLSVNGATFLEQHLIATVKWLTEQKGLAIYGIGLEFDSSRYYPKGIHVRGSDALGVELIKALPHWLSCEA